jgi:hypothetical protein
MSVYITKDGPQVGDMELKTFDDLPKTVQELISAVDDALPEDYNLWELEGDESVYFSKEGYEDEAIAEVRFATPREEGYNENGPKIVLIMVYSGPDLDNKTLWFDPKKAVDAAVKQINQRFKIPQEE